MSNDDSRGNESPDRQDASTPTDQTNNATASIQAHLEALDHLTRTLHARLENPTLEIDGEPVPADRRETARRRCREIRAQASLLGLRVLGPDAAISFRPADGPRPDDTNRGVTTYSGPTPETFERERRGQDHTSNRTSDQTPERNREPDCYDDTDRGERDD